MCCVRGGTVFKRVVCYAVGGPEASSPRSNLSDALAAAAAVEGEIERLSAEREARRKAGARSTPLSAQQPAPPSAAGTASKDYTSR
jgi:hypothetical protein